MEKKKNLPPKFPKATGIFILCGATALLLGLLSFVQGRPHANLLGYIGHFMSASLFFLFGLSSFFIPLFLGWLGMTFLLPKKEPFLRSKGLFFFLFLIALSLLFVMTSEGFPQLASLFQRWVPSNRSRTYLGGVPLHLWYSDLELFGLKSLLGKVGTLLLLSSLFFASSLVLLPPAFWKKIKTLLQRDVSAECESASPLPEPPPFTFVEEEEEPDNFIIEKAPPKIALKPKKTASPSQDYTLPPSTLLTAASRQENGNLKSDLKSLAKRLEETLQSFGIEAKVGNIHVGPTITSLEVQPSVGVKVQRIIALEHDIALNLQAKSIRIIAPIPGKAAVGIEVPNREPQEVSFRELLESYQSGEKKFHIPLLLGQGVAGEEIFADLVKMPHLIIAGATGSGKSVSINVIVMSLLMNTSSSDIKLLIVDPKKVELGAYSPLPHMIAPVVTEPHEAFLSLHWLVKEMERRYEILRETGLRNIQAYHTERLKNEALEPLPYIVVIIDELADLMMMSSYDIETPIIRLAQMARAIGIHLILATQRPSREVITGLIKANFPTRIAFKVASRINSQIILDDNGAETLLGNGDMLFLAPGASSSIRAQGAYVRDEDISRVIDFLSRQGPPNYLISSFTDIKAMLEKEEEETASSGGHDPLFEEAKKLIFDTGTASTTFLQRKLKIGYARAASLMDEMEAKGIVGPQEGAKPRKIFFSASMKGKEQ